MTDLQLVDKVCRNIEFLHPIDMRELERRGLMRYFNYLGTSNPEECKALVRARMASEGRYIGDPEIEQIAASIDRLQKLRNRLNALKITDAVKLLEVVEEMKTEAEYVRDYFKPTRIP